MKLNPYSNTHKGASIGFIPILFTLTLLIVHYFTGALDWPEVGNVRAQRDFNSAIGMSVITGYFWFTLRLIHQNVASTLISLLVKTNQLSQFSRHRHLLFSKLKHHCANSAIVAILITIIYVFVEGLFNSNSELHQLVLTINAILFWYFFCLFLIQVTTNIHYLKSEILVNIQNKIDLLNSISTLIRLGFINATISLGALALFPIFWFGKSIPQLDIFVVGCFAVVIGIYLFWPIRQLSVMWRKVKNNEVLHVFSSLQDTIRNEHQNIEKFKLIETERESLDSLSMITINLHDKLRLGACVCLVLLSWIIFGVLASLA
ncbi:hypothetical protein KUL152_14520 [Tenacibaculum sp. KUL152]|nr:hypothetical protein KUL152_14520 [Tenacibaculum sp. KUL152]